MHHVPHNIDRKLRQNDFEWWLELGLDFSLLSYVHVFYCIIKFSHKCSTLYDVKLEMIECFLKLFIERPVFKAPLIIIYNHTQIHYITVYLTHCVLKWDTTFNSAPRHLGLSREQNLWGIKYEPCSHKIIGQRQNARSLVNFPPAFIQTTAASYINYFPLCPVNYDSFCENELFCKKNEK